MQNIIEMKNITMKFGDIVANDKINLSILNGEIHALIGENGAGKSTLMSVLFGLYQPTSGYIKVRGESVVIKNPSFANKKLKLGMVHQHFKLVGKYNAVENIIIGQEPHKFNFIKWHEAKNKIKIISEKYNLGINFKTKVQDMSVGMQQRVEILKILYSESEVLIFDEPTAVLTPQEIKGFLNLLKDFREQGKTIIIITHKLEEIKEVADRATIIRRGNFIATVNVAQKTVSQMASLMVGRELVKVINVDNKTEDLLEKKNVLQVQNLIVNKEKIKSIAINDISFEVKSGEVLAIAGVEGNGQSELAKAISGLTKITKGKIYLNNKRIDNITIKKRYYAGLSFVPEDRHKHGLILDMTINDNIVNRSFYKKPFSRWGIINFKKNKNYAQKIMLDFDVRGANRGNKLARSLSGGNQQKAIIGREMSIDHNLLMVVQPTRGLDLGAIEYIHKKIIDEKNRGNGVLLISYELDEIISLADRVIVFNDAEITGMLEKKEINRAAIGNLMVKQTKDLEKYNILGGIDEKHTR